MLHTPRLMIPGILVLVAIGMVPASTSAATFAGVVPATDAQLAQLRGGFSIGRGKNRIKLALGIDRLTYVNGALAKVTHLSESGGTRLIQNGPGNHFDASLLSNLHTSNLGTVVQNSLDNQTIRNLNVFKVDVTMRQVAQSLSVRNAVDNALSRAMN